MADENYTAANFIGLDKRTLEQRVINLEGVLLYGPQTPEFFPDAEARALKVFAFTEEGAPGLLNIEPLFEAADVSESAAVAAAASALSSSNSAATASTAATNSASSASAAASSASSSATNASTSQAAATAAAASAQAAAESADESVPLPIEIDAPPTNPQVEGLFLTGAISVPSQPLIEAILSNLLIPAPPDDDDLPRWSTDGTVVNFDDPPGEPRIMVSGFVGVPNPTWSVSAVNGTGDNQLYGLFDSDNSTTPQEAGWFESVAGVGSLMVVAQSAQEGTAGAPGQLAILPESEESPRRVWRNESTDTESPFWKEDIESIGVDDSFLTDDFKSFFGQEYLQIMWRRLSTVTPSIRIAVWGDSTVENSDIFSLQDTWDGNIMIFRRLVDDAFYDVEISNFALAGQSAYQLATLNNANTISGALRPFDPHLNIVRTGINDLSDVVTLGLGPALAKLRMSYETIIQKIRDEYPGFSGLGDNHVTNILLITPNYITSPSVDTGPWLLAITRMLRELAREYKCAFMDLAFLMRDTTDPASAFFDVDGQKIHPAQPMQFPTAQWMFDFIFPQGLRALYGRSQLSEMTGVLLEPLKEKAVQFDAFPYATGGALQGSTEAPGTKDWAMHTIVQVDKFPFDGFGITRSLGLGGEYEFSVSTNPSDLLFARPVLSGPGLTVNPLSSHRIKKGEPLEILVVIKSGRIILYVNGERVFYSPYPSNYNFASGFNRIGCVASGDSYISGVPAGWMARVQMLNFAPGDDDVKRIFRTQGKFNSVWLNGTYASVAATAIVAGKQYKVLTVGTTDFTAIGGINEVGAVFTATAAGTGTGTVYLCGYLFCMADAETAALATFSVTTLKPGLPHKIVSVGTTDFTLIGSPNNTVGQEFTPNAVGTGTGTVSIMKLNDLSGHGNHISFGTAMSAP